MILTVGHTKGGVGKSTLALQIAITRTLAGKNVLLVDADKQQTSRDAISIREMDGRTPAINCQQYRQRAEFAKIDKDAGEYDDIIIDAGGRDNEALRYAILISDALLVPVAPKSAELWALRDMGQVVEETKAIRPNVTAYAFLNMAEPGESPDNAAAIAYVSADPRFKFLDKRIQNRKAISTAMGSGLSIFELKRKDRKAEAELEDLISFFF
jgi:chromosome partitioning protein